MPFHKQTCDKLKSIVNGQLSIVRKSKGFTLIELLVVITILGLLMALAFASYSKAQQKTRDSRRKQDLTAIQKALELARQDSPGGFYFPCPASCPGTNVAPPTMLSVANPTPYISAIPTDPVTTNPYLYTVPGTGTCNTSQAWPNGGCTSYTLSACIENSSDQDPKITTDSTACPTAPNKKYTVNPN